ncbi:MAG TPA: alpha/beta hydrolase [Candidatus Tumulicola sp.]
MLAPLALAALVANPCTYAGFASRCGTLSVPENRETRRGRSISLRLVVIPPKNDGGREPIFAIAGGPGQSAVDAYRDEPSGDGFLTKAHDTRTIVMVDQRGSGGSSPMACDLYADARTAYAQLFPATEVAACRRALAATHDLNAYGTDAAVDDLDAVRRALGFRTIVLYGGSYGTDAALVYLRRHESSVAAEILAGVAPPSLLLPKPFPKGAQHALADLEAACARDAKCSRNFPHFSTEFDAMLERARRGGIAVDGGSISFEVLADSMRHVMYDAYTASYLPEIVHRWSGGDATPLAKTVLLMTRGIAGSLAMGMNLSITCAESMPFITPTQAVRAAAGTFMGTSRYDAQRVACAAWDVRPVSASFLVPVRSRVPVLLLGGSDDPATPPEFGARMLAGLPNGRQILVPGAGHDITSACVERLEINFLAAYNARSLDTTCLQAQRRPPFATSMSGLL